MNPLIYAAMHDEQVKIWPGEFLGPGVFKIYRDLCLNSGCAYVPKLSANLVRLDLLPALLKRLKTAFTVKLGADVLAAAEKRSYAIVSSQEEAKSRVASLKDQPYPFQLKGIEFLASRPTAVLADEMGLGKTPQSLLAIPKDMGGLVVCPASLKGEWLKAATRWRSDMKSRIVDAFVLPNPGEFIITNYERLPPEEQIALHKDHVFINKCVIIADECHCLKSSKSLRTKRFRALAKAVRAAGGFTWGLSGTPMANSPMDLLNVLQAFDLLRDSFGSYPRFCSMFSGKQDYWGKWTWGQPKPGAVETLQRVMLRRLREDVLPNLPTITYQDIEVDVTAAARRASDEARAAMAAAGVDLQMVIDGKATLGAASDSVFTARRMLAEAKIAAMLEIVEEYEGAKEPLIVFSAHRAPIEAVGAHGAAAILGDNSAESRSSIVHDFQSGIGNCIGLTIKSGAVGFTLTRAAHIVMVDQEWTPDWNQQAVSRACRIGQTRGVLVKRLIAPDTIDQDVMRILDEKQRSIDATVDQTQGQSIQATPEELWNIK